MRRLGCLVALIGLLVVSCSLFLFGAAIARMMRPDNAVMVELPLSGAELPLAGHARVRLSCRLELDSGSVDREGGRWVARYAVPLTWRVERAPGDELGGATASMAWDAAERRVIDQHGTPEGASVIVEQTVARIALPADAHAHAWASLGEDVAWHANVRRAFIVLRDDEPGSGALALSGIAMLALGPMLIASGIATVIMSFFAKRRQKREAASAKPEADGAQPP